MTEVQFGAIAGLLYIQIFRPIRDEAANPTHNPNQVGEIWRVFDHYIGADNATNVKMRGTWGEVQLGTLIEQMLIQDQYAKNVRTVPNSNDLVEFAIKLPGRDGERGSHIWLPIDSKFHKSDYDRILEASDLGDKAAVEAALCSLAAQIRNAAKYIRNKYICAPATTDFGILFVPTEGLYAEVLRIPGLADEIQEQQRVVIAGPTTITAMLNSFRLGFHTLAIEQRASEVWKVLAAVKTEFGRFGGVLKSVKDQLEKATRTIESTGVRTRAMERQLRNVESLPADEAEKTLMIEAQPPEREELDLGCSPAET